jgi:hypothetical protein
MPISPGVFKLLLIAIAELMLKFPQILDWVSQMRDNGKTQVTDVEWDALENKWDIPGAMFFE